MLDKPGFHERKFVILRLHFDCFALIVYLISSVNFESVNIRSVLLVVQYLVEGVFGVVNVHLKLLD